MLFSVFWCALERLSDRDAQQVKMRAKLKQALKDVQEGIAATRRAVQERCRVRQAVSA